MSQSSDVINKQWKLKQRLEGRQHVERGARNRPSTEPRTAQTRTGKVVYHAKRRAALLEQYRSYGSNGRDLWGRVRQPVKRDVKLSELHTEAELFDHRDHQLNVGERERIATDLDGVLEREGVFEDLIDVQEFNGRLVVLDGHTRLEAYRRFYEQVNTTKTRGRKRERLTVLEHFGNVDEALKVSRKENSKRRQVHPDRERKQIAWLAWLENEGISRPAQARASGLGETAIAKMRLIYNKVLRTYSREQLKQYDWLSVEWLYKTGGPALSDDEIEARHMRLRAFQERADQNAIEGIRATFGKRPLKQPRRARIALVSNYGSDWLQAIAADDRREHPVLDDQEEGQNSEF